MSNSPKHMVGKILKASGEAVPFEIEGEYPELEEMQDAVGGWIEYIRLSQIPPKGFTEPCVMVVNEEGLIHRLPVNLEASVIAQQDIVGDVIILPARLVV